MTSAIATCQSFEVKLAIGTAHGLCSCVTLTSGIANDSFIDVKITIGTASTGALMHRGSGWSRALDANGLGCHQPKSGLRAQET